MLFSCGGILSHTFQDTLCGQTAFVCRSGAGSVYIGISDDGSKYVVYVVFLFPASGGKDADSKSVLSMDRLSDPDLSDRIL